MTGEYTREPPHDLAAEQAALGGALLSRDAAADMLAVVSPQDFYRPAHQVICEVIDSMLSQGEPADAVTVAAELTRRGDITKTGGHPYLHTLIASVPTAANAGWYARIVAAKARSRSLIEAGTQLAQAGWESADPSDATETARRVLDTMAARAADGEPPSMAELMAEVTGSLETSEERGIPTGIAADLDDALTGGLVPGQLVIVAARPAVGKSVFACQAAVNASLRLGLPALLVSLEMPAQELTTRIIAAEAKVPLGALLRRRLTDSDWERIKRHYGELANSPLVIDYAPGCTLSRVRARLRAMQRTTPARLLVVDYLQLVRPAGSTENRQAAVAEVARDLKDIAGEFAIPVLAASQLNRNSERRTDRRPELSDLRESGEQEAAADAVILLHREDAYDRETTRPGEMDLIIAKQRQGRLGDITVAFQGDYARIVDLARPWTGEPLAGAA